MTPAVTALDGLKLPYELLEYELSGSSDKDIGLAAARALGLPEAAVFKTLIAELADGALVVAVIPVAEKLNLKQLARACGVKSAKMADTRAAERATGYLTGGISPLGQKRSHRTYFRNQPESPQRNTARHFLNNRMIVVWCPPRTRGPWPNSVNANIVFGQINGHGPRHGINGPFRDVRGEPSPVRPDPAHRGDMDDISAAAVTHHACRVRRAEVRPANIGGQLQI